MKFVRFILFLVVAMTVSACASDPLVWQDTCKYQDLVQQGHPVYKCKKADL